MGKARKAAPKIWPGPEPLKSTPIKRGDHVVVLDRRGEPEHETTVASVGQHFVEVPSPTRTGCLWLVDPKRVVPIRTYSIALAHVKARARMERFRAWLDSRHAPRSLIAYVGKHLSPEVAVSSMMRADVRHYLCSVFACMGANITRTPCPGCQPVLAASLLVSPEWASLPWQADPEAETPMPVGSFLRSRDGRKSGKVVEVDGDRRRILWFGSCTRWASVASLSRYEVRLPYPNKALAECGGTLAYEQVAGVMVTREDGRRRRMYRSRCLRCGLQSEHPNPATTCSALTAHHAG